MYLQKVTEKLFKGMKKIEIRKTIAIIQQRLKKKKQFEIRKK